VYLVGSVRFKLSSFSGCPFLVMVLDAVIRLRRGPHSTSKRSSCWFLLPVRGAVLLSAVPPHASNWSGVWLFYIHRGYIPDRCAILSSKHGSRLIQLSPKRLELELFTSIN
jgi:hypothetical protein